MYSIYRTAWMLTPQLRLLGLQHDLSSNNPAEYLLPSHKREVVVPTYKYSEPGTRFIFYTPDHRSTGLWHDAVSCRDHLSSFFKHHQENVSFLFW